MTLLNDDTLGILIIDDVPANLAVIGNYLRDEGYRVHIATSGESAVRRVTQVLPDLILLDILMPGMDGFETCHHIKSNPQTADIPIIMLTALEEEKHKTEAFKVGAVDFITKPVQREIILARVETQLRLRQLQTKYQEQQERIKKLESGASIEDIRKMPMSEEDAALLTEQLLQAARSGNTKEVRKALIYGADINVLDHEGKTPLIWAAYFSRKDTFRFLLEAGADTTVVDNEGFTAQEWAELAEQFGDPRGTEMLAELAK